MILPPVVICSLWRNDCHRRLVDRVAHLLAKALAYPSLRYIWVVGDSRDDTARALADLARDYRVTIIDIGDTGIEGDDHPSRLRRLGETANEWWHWCENAEYVMVHESDIVSPPNVVNQLVAHAGRGRCPIAGWPVLELHPNHRDN